MSYSISQDELTELDQVIEQARGLIGESQCDLLVEHLQSARVFLMGGMPEEGAVSLELARQVSKTVRSDTFRGRSEKMIQRLLSGVGSVQQPSS